jgi:general secretion pathway protein D
MKLHVFNLCCALSGLRFAARIFIILIVAIPSGIIAGSRQQPNLQQTPFGLREVPGAPAAAPSPAAAPPAPASQPQAAPAAPQPQTPAAPPAAAAAAAPAAQASAAQPADDLVPISFDLDNTDIYQVIKIVADNLKLNYIIDPGIKGSVNIHTSGSLKRSDLLPLLETLLKINGATMVKVGNFYQILPTPLAIRQPLPVLQTVQTAPDDQIVIQIIRMKFVAAAEMARLLTPYLSEGANIVSHDSGNILLVSERRSNLRKLLDLIDVFDTKVFEGDRVRLYPAKNNLVRELVGDLRNVFAGYGLSETGGAIKFLALDRLNSVLVVTGNPDIFSEVERWIGRLDQPLATAGIRNYVYKVKNNKALDLSSLLTNLYAPTRGAPAAPPLPGQPQQAAPGVPIPFSSTAAPSGPGSDVLSSAAVGNVRIIADSITNSLIIQASPQEWNEIERTLQQLDILPRQVLVDAQIYEVTLSDSLNVSLSSILQQRGTLTNPQTTASFASTGGGPPALAAQTFGFVGHTRELIAFLNASENRARVRTLSAPSVLVKDNMVADFTVGADIPVPTTSAVTAGVQSGGNSVFTQTISFRSVGVLMKVRPQINEGGTLTLEVSQEVSDAQPNTTDTIAAPVIGKSSVNSTIVVQDNETIAIGGFIRENKELDRSRLPLLGRIPGVGVLFGNTSNSTSRTELVVLITPHVIRTREEAESSTEELKAKLKEVQKLIK